MAKSHSTENMLSYEVIAAATQGDVTALCKVLEHYEGYILKLSTRVLRDEYGNEFSCVDNELYERLKVYLITRTLMFNAT